MRRGSRLAALVVLGTTLVACSSASQASPRKAVSTSASPGGSADAAAALAFTTWPDVWPSSVPYPWPAEVGDGRPCGPPTWTDATAKQKATAPGRGRRVLALGDSLFRETRRVDVDPGARVITRALVAQGWNPTVVCWGGKDVVWGESQLRTLASLSAIPDRVVISLGTNDLFLGHVAPAVFAQRVQSLLDFLRGSRAPSAGPEVLWVDQWVDLTLSVPKAKVNREHDDMRGYQQFNAALADLCTVERNCRLVSWSDAVSARADRGFPLVDRTLDGIHLSAAGTALRVKLIATALAGTAAD